MKPLERIFFQACVKNIGKMRVRDVVNVFYELGFPAKRLWYYLDKWNRLRFYMPAVTEDLGWFELGNLPAEYKTMYDDIMNQKGGAE